MSFQIAVGVIISRAFQVIFFGRRLPRFPSFRNSETTELQDPSVNNLDALDLVVVSNLVQLGRHHASIVGFKVEYLDAFRTAMTDVWESKLGSEHFCGRTRKAWSSLFLLITSSVLEGYQQRCSELKFTKPPSADVDDSTELEPSNDLRDIDSETA